MSGSSHTQLHAHDSPVSGTLDSASFSSEPPDIRNWFASYVYESPELNSADGFQDLDRSGETCIEGEKKERSGEIRNAGESEVDSLAAAKGSLDGIVHHNELDDCDYIKYAVLDSQDVEPNAMPSTQIHSTLKRVGVQKLLGETGNNCHVSVAKSGPASTYNIEDDLKMDQSLIDRTNDNILHSVCNNYNQDDEQSHERSIRRNKSTGKENLYYDVSLMKENDGFISTRKKNRRDNTTGNIEIPKDGLPLVTNFHKCANKSRKVLSENSDLHRPDALVSTGKWQCPQKNKRDLGPPLKQLRLEQWVQRL